MSLAEQVDGAAARRRVWRLAWPVILSSMSITALGAVDTAVMGHLPDPTYIGGVAIGATVVNFVYWTMSFLRMGTTGITAQAHGANDLGEVQAAVRRALLIAGAIGLCLVPLAPLVFSLAFAEFGPSAAVRAHAEDYTAIRAWGFPASLGTMVVLGWLIGLQRTRRALVVQVAFNALNVVLALLFVYGFQWGVPGMATATLIAEWFGLALGLWAIRHVGRQVGGRAARIFDRKRLFAVARINIDVFLRSVILTGAQAHFALKGAAFGDAVLAANAVLIAIHSVLGQGLDGFAFAAEALVGNAIGRRDRAALDRAVRAAFVWAIAVACAFSFAYAGLGYLAVSAITSLDSVRQVAFDFLPWSAAVPFVLVWGYMLDGIFNGATRTADMRNAMILSAAVYIGAIWTFVPLMGNHGLWAAFFALQGARALTLGAMYPRVARMAGPRA